MRSSLVLAVTGLALALASAVAYRYSASEPDDTMKTRLESSPMPSAPTASGAGVPAPGMPVRPEAATPRATSASPARVVVSPGAYRPSAADSGAVAVEAAPTYFTGPDGELLLVTEAPPEAAVVSDDAFRAAVLEEIQNDPEAFAAAMKLEAGEVRAVASGERELPLEWILAAQ